MVDETRDVGLASEHPIEDARVAADERGQFVAERAQPVHLTLETGLDVRIDVERRRGHDHAVIEDWRGDRGIRDRHGARFRSAQGGASDESASERDGQSRLCPSTSVGSHERIPQSGRAHARAYFESGRLKRRSQAMGTLSRMGAEPARRAVMLPPAFRVPPIAVRPQRVASLKLTPIGPPLGKLRFT